MLLVQLLINGLQLGAIYALTAVGFALIFGSTKVFHVAHGASFTIAGYLVWWAMSALQWHWLAAMGLATLAVVLFGLFMERCVYRPIQRHEGAFFTVFIAAFGMQIIVQNLIGTVFGRNFETVTVPLSQASEVLPNVFVAPLAGVAVVVALAFFMALTLFLSRTQVGTGLRALADNPDLVRIFGLEPTRLAQVAFALGSALVVPAAALTAMSQGINPGIGAHIMLISLAATIVGGIGSLKGAALGGLLLGLAESLAVWKLDPQWSEAVTFVILFVFIIFRPAGFMGRPHGAK
ncbi:MAG: branched-chain amino acid ABC transporter permease [Hylemonella sp.]|jgi:branched-chain amino acid transport system permease protein